MCKNSLQLEKVYDPKHNGEQASIKRCKLKFLAWLSHSNCLWKKKKKQKTTARWNKRLTELQAERLREHLSKSFVPGKQTMQNAPF